MDAGGSSQSDIAGLNTHAIEYLRSLSSCGLIQQA